MRIILYQPELANNVGNIIRTCVCFEVELIIIRPTSFIWNEKQLKHKALDYLNKVNLKFFDSFQEVQNYHKDRIIAASCKTGSINYKNFNFLPTDAIIMGQESVGLPDEILNNLINITIPIKDRSLNLATATSILIAHFNN